MVSSILEVEEVIFYFGETGDDVFVWVFSLDFSPLHHVKYHTNELFSLGLLAVRVHNLKCIVCMVSLRLFDIF